MCFSATASFAAGITLTAVGAITIKKSESSSQWMFSGIPIIFGVQQLVEGVVWLSLNNPDYAYLKTVSVYVFMAFAQVLWPLWVPISILLLEKDPLRKKLLYITSTVGIIVSVYLGYCLASFHVDAYVREHHIFYDRQYPHGMADQGAALYLTAIIFTPFLSGIKKMWILGLFTVMSFVAAYLFFNNYVISVWCMFAAVISVVILYMMPHLNEHYRFHKKN